jgi:hypothetical protein
MKLREDSQVGTRGRVSQFLGTPMMTLTLAATLCGFAGRAWGALEIKSGKPTIKETALGAADPVEMNAGRITVSPDGRRVAWLQPTGRDNLPFKLSSKRSFISIQGHTASLVVDGKVGPGGYMQLGAPVFSPDSRRCGTLAMKPPDKGGVDLVLDGVASNEGLTGLDLGTLRFSPDGARVSYVGSLGVSKLDPDTGEVTDDGPECLVLDGRKQIFPDVSPVVFSPDSKRVAFAAYDGKKWAAVVDGQRGQDYDGVAALQFTPDSAHVVYRALLKNVGEVLVIGDRATPPADEILKIQFNPTGKGLACIVHKDNKDVLLNDGKPAGPPCDEILLYTFSPDGKHLAYLAAQGSKGAIVRDGVIGKAYNRAGNLHFSHNGSHLAYTAQLEDGQYCVVLNDKEGPPWAEIGQVHLSTDGGTLIYEAKQSDGSWKLVRNGKAGPARKHLSNTVLSADGRHTLGWATLENGRQILHNDQPIGATYDGKVPNSNVVLQPDGTFCALGHRGGVIYRIEGKVE